MASERKYKKTSRKTNKMDIQIRSETNFNLQKTGKRQRTDATKQKSHSR